MPFLLLFALVRRAICRKINGIPTRVESLYEILVLFHRTHTHAVSVAQMFLWSFVSSSHVSTCSSVPSFITVFLFCFYTFLNIMFFSTRFNYYKLLYTLLSPSKRGSQRKGKCSLSLSPLSIAALFNHSTDRRLYLHPKCRYYRPDWGPRSPTRSRPGSSSAWSDWRRVVVVVVGC